MGAKFGPAGAPERFYEEGHKASLEIPEWLKNNGLDAFEVQCGRGVRFSDESAKRLGELAVHNGITLSIHSPYYINISTPDADNREKSFGYIFDSARFAKIIRAERIVVHMGSPMGATREVALELSKDFMRECLERLDNEGLSGIILCPETMGKNNQMGTLEEVLDLCKISERLIPTIDFGHMNARGQGSIKTIDDYAKILEKVENVLGIGVLKKFHSHFSMIEYTAGGEKKHLTFDVNNGFGPPYEPLMELVAKKNLSPTFICESNGTQADDALKMKKAYKVCQAN